MSTRYKLSTMGYIGHTIAFIVLTLVAYKEFSSGHHMVGSFYAAMGLINVYTAVYLIVRGTDYER